MVAESLGDRAGAESACDIVLPPRKRFRGSANLTRPFQTFRDIRHDAYSKADYQVDESWPFEEERAASDALLVPAFVFTHSFHFTKSSTAQAAPTIAHEMLWRCAGNEVGDCKAAAIKLCHELGKGTDCDAPVTSALEYSLTAIAEWGKRTGSVKAKDRPVKLQPYNTAQQYASGVCEGLGLRFDWYKSIVESMEELLNDILEEFRREGNISLPEVPPSVIGVRERKDVEGPRYDGDANLCQVMLRVDSDGCVHAAIEKSTGVRHANAVGNADTAGDVPHEAGVETDQISREEHPILVLPGVKAAQDLWTSAETFDIPTIVPYSAERDTMLMWRKRMEPVRERWKLQDEEKRKKALEDAAKKEVEDARRAAEEAKQAEERAKQEAQLKAQQEAQRKAEQESAQQRARAAQHAAAQRQAAQRQAAQQQALQQQAAQQQAAQQHAAQQQAAQQQAAQQQAAQQQAAQQQAAQQQAAQQHAAQQHAAQQHAAQQQAAQQHAAQQQAVQQHVAQQQAAQQHAPQQQSVQSQAAQQHATQHHAAHQQGAQQQAAQQQAAQQQAAQQQVAQQQAGQQHAAQQQTMQQRQAIAHNHTATQHQARHTHSAPQPQAQQHGQPYAAAAYRPPQPVNQPANLSAPRQSNSPAQPPQASQNTHPEPQSVVAASQHVGQQQPRPAVTTLPTPLQRRTLRPTAPTSQRPQQHQQPASTTGPAATGPSTGPRPQSLQPAGVSAAHLQYRAALNTGTGTRPLIRPVGARPPGAVLNSARPANSSLAARPLHSQTGQQAGASGPAGTHWQSFLKHRLQQHNSHATPAEAVWDAAAGAAAGRAAAVQPHSGMQTWASTPGAAQCSGPNPATAPNGAPGQQMYGASQQAQLPQTPPSQQHTQSPQQYRQSPQTMQPTEVQQGAPQQEQQQRTQQQHMY